eukprot:sb/3464396/
MYVPQNIGICYVDLPGLNDLTLLAADGRTVQANSFVLSANSSVIKETINRREAARQIEIDLSEFSEETVKKFVWCCYTGLRYTGEGAETEVKKLVDFLGVDWYRKGWKERLGESLRLKWFLQAQDDMTTPKLQLPQNFGTENLEITGLLDLKFETLGGRAVEANSFVMACNSPVIYESVGKNIEKEVDLQEFSDGAVNCFVYACYTGCVKQFLTEEYFREINKLSIALKVEWIQKECLTFYCKLCANLTNSLGNALFLFEEAAFLTKEAGSIGRKFQDALDIGLRSYPDLRLRVVENFMSRDLASQLAAKADLCVQLAEDSPIIEVIYRRFIDILSDKTQPFIFNECERRLINCLTVIQHCQCCRPDIYYEFRNVLNSGISEEDLRIMGFGMPGRVFAVNREADDETDINEIMEWEKFRIVQFPINFKFHVWSFPGITLLTLRKSLTHHQFVEAMYEVNSIWGTVETFVR